MNGPRRLSCCALAALATLPVLTHAQRPQPGIIRSRISMVPIVEDGVPQEIAHFAVQALTPDPKMAEGPPQLLVPTGDLRAQNRRVFLLLLGRGRMGSGASKELDALTTFLRERLLPQDVVGVIAYNRATDFTTDHKAVVEIVERYRTRHLQIETDLFEWFACLRAAYGQLTIPPSIQKQIDDVFAESAALRPRELVPGQITDKERLQRDIKNTTNELLRAEAIAGREGGHHGRRQHANRRTAGRHPRRASTAQRRHQPRRLEHLRGHRVHALHRR